MPLAPFFPGGARGKATAQHIAFAFQLRQGLVDLRSGQAEWFGNAIERQRPEGTEPRADQFEDGVVGFPDLVEVRQRLQRRRQFGLVINRPQAGQALQRQPQRLPGVDLQTARAAAVGQGLEPVEPLRIGAGLGIGDARQAHQGLVHFVDPAGRGPGFVAHGGNRLGVQGAEVVGGLRVAPAPIEHCLGSTFLQRCIVEKGIGPGAENLRRQRRGRRQVAADQANVAAFHAPQQGQPALAVHGFVQAIVEGLFHQRMVGNLPFAGEVFHAGDLIGKHAGDQVFAFHPLDLRRDFAPAAVARQRQGHAGIPAPAHAEQRRVEHGLNQQVLGAVAVQVAPDIVQFKTVAGGQRQHDGVFAGGGLQFEVEGATETLAQGQAPGAVDAAAERRVNDQLRAAGLVEKALHQQCVLGWQGTQRLPRTGQVIHQLFGAGDVQTQGLGQPVERWLQVTWRSPQQVIELCLQARHRRGQFGTAPRCFTEPERNGRRLALGILDPDFAGFHPQDPIGRVA
ncbi:hypothetical protein D3C73_685880 [compost metagenome]